MHLYTNKTDGEASDIFKVTFRQKCTFRIYKETIEINKFIIMKQK